MTDGKQCPGEGGGGGGDSAPNLTWVPLECCFSVREADDRIVGIPLHLQHLVQAAHHGSADRPAPLSPGVLTTCPSGDGDPS